VQYYTIYKTINNKNSKEYIGFHSLKNDEILYEFNSQGSIFKSGYLGSGKIIRDAIIKYGPESFSQELVLITEDKEEAENLERELVNQDWVESKDTYNLSIGGNICILFGENNGFYGKKHSQETLDKIQHSRNKTLIENKFSWCESYLVSDKSIKFHNKNDICEYFNLDKNLSRWFLDKEIWKLVYENKLKYKSDFLNSIAIKHHEHELNKLTPEEQTKIRAQQCSERFKGVAKSEESNLKRGKSIKEWIENNQDEHKERMNKINKNPEKIAKTAEKHRGMKRSLETKINLAIANKNNKRKYKNKLTGEFEILKTSDISDFSNYEKIPFKLYKNSEDSIKGIYNGDKIPKGFTLFSEQEY
jgi:hypothetical protein